MTVSSTTRRAGPYPGNGVATSFPFSFKVFAKTDISVVFANASGVESTLVLDSDYSVTLNADQNANPGGSITYPISGSPMLSTQALAIVGALDYAQTTALPSGGAYNASIVERALDRIVILAQQLKETVNRGVQLGFTTASNVSSRLPAPRALSVLGWSADEQSLTNLDAAALGITISYANWRNKTFNGTGAQTAFVLDTDAGVSTNCDVSVSGLAQTADINFSYDAPTKTINFLTGAPPVGTNNVVVRYGQALPQGTMTSAGITDSTATGRAVLTAANQAAARTAIGAAAPLGYTAADDSTVVKLTGNQTVAGIKTFSTQPVLPQAPTLTTAVATTSGTAVDITGIPAWANEITIPVNAVSTSGTSNLVLQLGATTIETSGYSGANIYMPAGSATQGSNHSTAFTLFLNLIAASVVHGMITLVRVSGNTWAFQSNLSRSGDAAANISSGTKTLAGALDRVRLTTAGGTDTFDAGSYAVFYK